MKYYGVIDVYRVILLIFFVGAIFPVQATEESPSLVMDQANRAYIEGDYNTAILLYESILEQGIMSGSLYYNLGSAYYQSDILDLALVNFLRARDYIPRDVDLYNGLSKVRGKRIDLLGDEKNFVDAAANLTSGLVTSQEMIVVAYCLWVFCFAIGLIMLLAPKRRDGLRSILLMACLVLFVLVFLLASRLYVEIYRPQAVVVGASTQIYSGPGDDYLPLYSLSPAAELRVVQHRDGWGRFILADGRVGWISLEHVTLVKN